MKKILFLASLAAVAMTSCTSESNEYVGDNTPKEIAFNAFSQNLTRSTTDGTSFNTGYTIKAAAYDITNSRTFFAETDFTKGTTYWQASPKKFWPLSETAISFLAYTEFTPAASDPVTWTNTQTLVLKMGDNKQAQKDLMYACGFGAVTANGTNGLDFPSKVDMTFKHAQAWIAFNVNADATSNNLITLKSITLNGAKYIGTYTVTHAGWNSTTLGDHSVSGTWGSISGSANVAVPGWTAAAVSQETDPGVAVGNGLLVVPDDTANSPDFTSFTITYELDGKEYTYTYTPASVDLQQGKKYIFNITFKLHEILINPTVENWGSGSTTVVDVI